MKKLYLFIVALSAIILASSCKKEDATFNNLPQFNNWVGEVIVEGQAPGQADKNGLQQLNIVWLNPRPRPAFNFKYKDNEQNNFTLSTSEALPWFPNGVTLQCQKESVTNEECIPFTIETELPQGISFDKKSEIRLIQTSTGIVHCLTINYTYSEEYTCQDEDSKGKLLWEDEEKTIPVKVTKVAEQVVTITIRKDLHN